MVEQATPKPIPFSERSIAVLKAANDDAHRFDHRNVSTDHVLMGLLQVGDPLVDKILDRSRINPAKVTTAIEQILGHGTPFEGPTGYTPRLSKVLRLASVSARKHGETTMTNLEVEPINILDGIVTEGEGVAAGILEALGISTKALRTVVQNSQSSKHS